MKSFLLIYTFLILFTSSFCKNGKLPPTFKRCDVKKSDFEECLTEAIPDALRQLKEPIKELGLPSLSPLVIPVMSVAPGPGPTGFQQNYTNMKVSGFTNMSCSKVNLNFEKLTMIMWCSSPGIKIETEYSFNGSIGVLPIYGNGTGTTILDKMNCFHSFHFKEYQKGGQKYFKVVNSLVRINPTKVIHRYDNLYDGDKTLGDNVNMVMNDNWKEIYENVKPNYEEAFTTVFADLVNRVLSRVPVSAMFINA